MSYVDPNYKTKKAFKAAVTSGAHHRTYNPSGMSQPTQNGHDVIEGPHYPKAHQWHASVEVRDGIVTKVLG